MRENSRSSWIILGFLFVYMWLLNALMPLHRDDYEYALIWNTTQHIAGFSDVIQSLYNHYLQHGGRMADYFFQEHFLWWGKSWYNPVGAMLYVFLNILIYWHSQHRVTTSFNSYVLSIVILFTWFGLPDWGVTNIWMNGSCVYLFSSVLVFSMLLPYNIELLGKGAFNDSVKSILLCLIFGIYAAWSIENTAGSMILLIFIACVWAYRLGRLKKWMISGWVGAMIGYALLILAPGNFVRVAHTSSASLVKRVLNQFAGGFELYLSLLLVVGLFMLVWRVLLVDYSKANGLLINHNVNKFACVRISRVPVGAVLVLVLSKLSGGLIANAITSLLYIFAPQYFGAGADIALQKKIITVISGIEDLLIYLLMVTQVYKYIYMGLGLLKSQVRAITPKLSFKTVLRYYPQTYFAVAMLAIALVNQLVMLAAPTFPGRAAYGSAVFIIIGAVSLLDLPQIQEVLRVEKHKVFIKRSIGLLLVPMMIVVAWQYYGNYREDAVRMEYVRQVSAQGIRVIEIPRLEKRNEVLRHVYFVDFPNGVTEGGFKRYYGFDEIKVK